MFHMALFRQITDHHHAQHAATIHHGVGDPALSIPRHFLNDLLMDGGDLFGAAPSGPYLEVYDGQHGRGCDLESSGLLDPDCEASRQFQLSVDVLLVGLTTMDAQ